MRQKLDWVSVHSNFIKPGTISEKCLQTESQSQISTRKVMKIPSNAVTGGINALISKISAVSEIGRNFEICKQKIFSKG